MNHLFDKTPKEVLLELFLPMAVGFMMLVCMDFSDVVAAQRVSTEALSIVNYCFPIIYFVLAAGIGINQGLTVSGADAYTKGDNQRLHQLIVSAILVSMVLAVLMLSIVWVAIAFNGVDSGFMIYLSQIKMFLAIVLSSALPLFSLLVLCAWLQIQGRVNIIRNTLVLMLFSTITLHTLLALPIGLGLGINGIAISKFSVVMIGIGYILIQIRKEVFHFGMSSWCDIAKLYKNIFAAIGIQVLVPIYLYALNQYVADFGVNAVSGFITGYRIAMLMVIPILAVLIALMVIISHYDSLKMQARINETVRYILSRGSIAILIALVLTAFLGNVWMNVSGVELEVKAIAMDYLFLAIILTVFEFIVGVSIVFHQAVQRPLSALLLALTKTIIFPIPLLYLAMAYEPLLVNVWWAILMAFLLSALLSVGKLYHEGVLVKIA
ncbi:MATE family efflux transporter [Gammaproteobacteria bacterium]|nr:MATE family efflux transporter [Gammaproteobacteria bacterium]